MREITSNVTGFHFINILLSVSKSSKQSLKSNCRKDVALLDLLVDRFRPGLGLGQSYVAVLSRELSLYFLKQLRFVSKHI